MSLFGKFCRQPQSDSASGAGLVFIAASAAAAACAAAAAAFLLAIQRKDKKELPADACSKTRGVIDFASGVCVCKVQHVKWRRVTQP